jgi:hypothetical protein
VATGLAVAVSVLPRLMPAPMWPRRCRMMLRAMMAGDVMALAGPLVSGKAPVLMRRLVPVALVAALVNDLDRGRMRDHDGGAERSTGPGLGCREGRREQDCGGQSLDEHRLPPCGSA